MKSLSNFYQIDKKGCWRFSGYVSDHGYGRLYSDGRTYAAHRYFYEKLVGKIPDGLTIDHQCRVRDCVNPKHLKPMTLIENIKLGNGAPQRNTKKKRCPNGHKFDLIKKVKGGKTERCCHRCKLAYARQLWMRKRVAGLMFKTLLDEILK